VENNIILSSPELPHYLLLLNTNLGLLLNRLYILEFLILESAIIDCGLGWANVTGRDIRETILLALHAAITTSDQYQAL
jgi:hypothetical protein